MATFVLLPGFWLGAWAWHDVAKALRGHDVRPLSLTGLGERVHLARPDTDLETHVLDVLNFIRYEDLRDVVLVGHSYAGAVVVPSVADRVPDRISRLVFVDSGPLPDGMAQQDFTSPEEQSRNAQLVQTEGNAWKLPPPAWEELAAEVVLADGVLDRVKALSAPQPWATATTPVRLTGAWEKVPRVNVMCGFTEAMVRQMAASVPAFKHMVGDNVTYSELPGWHWPMFDKPAALAAVLDSVVEG
jgi:pimeloyl-ACP methyl ester carboxylesterase